MRTIENILRDCKKEGQDVEKFLQDYKEFDVIYKHNEIILKGKNNAAFDSNKAPGSREILKR